ncbi:MAG: ATP-grasp fold amidoligase family protein [Bacilli bacterium]
MKEEVNQMSYASLKESLKKSTVVESSYLVLLKMLYSINPKIAVKFEFLISMGYSLDLKNPITFNEKIQYLKFNEKRNLITNCADKILVRDYIISKGYKAILNDILGVYDNAEQINYDLLPNQFALKCNHGCGYNIICKDKSQLNIEEANEKLNSWLKEKFGVLHYEPQYFNINRKILCEKYLESESGGIMNDYKLYCSQGKVLMIRVITGREDHDLKKYHFDKNWNFLESNTSESIKEIQDKLKHPEKINEIIEISENLSKDFKFVRVDFYVIRNKVIFGELTFTPTGGFDTGFTKELDIWLGSQIDLN